jgi:hypothetical protein
MKDKKPPESIIVDAAQLTPEQVMARLERVIEGTNAGLAALSGRQDGVTALAKGLQEIAQKAFTEMAAQLNAMEARIAALEQAGPTPAMVLATTPTPPPPEREQPPVNYGVRLVGLNNWEWYLVNGARRSIRTYETFAQAASAAWDDKDAKDMTSLK